MAVENIVNGQSPSVVYNPQESIVVSTPDKSVYVAGRSERRMLFIKHVFELNGNSNVYSVEGGAEEDIEDVSSIVRGKIDHVRTRLENESLDSGQVILIGADTRTRIPIRVDDSILLRSKGKPKSLNLVRQSFIDMGDAQEEGSPYYVVESASVIQELDNFHVVKEDQARETCTVQLNAEAVRRLGTTDGFANYLKEFEEFYTRPPYLIENMTSLSVLDLSSGISLPILVKMGAVTSINGVPYDDPNFRSAFLTGLHTVYVGIASNLVERFHPNPEHAKKAIRKWEWLNSVADSVLDRNGK